MVGRHLVGFVRLNLQFCVSRFPTFSGVRVAQSLVFCVMVRILLVGFVCLNLQFSASWLGDFQGGSCGSNIRFLCHGRQIFSGVHVAESLVFCVMVGRLLVGFVRLNLQFSRSRMATFSGVRVAQSLLFCLMVGRLLVGSCGSIFRFLCHDWWTFSGVRVAQSFVFCVMVGRLLVGFVCLNLQFSVSWLVDIQWASCVSIFRFLCHGRYTFSGVREAQSFVFCVMVGRLLVGFVLLNLQFSVAWLVDFQWGSCVSIFSFLCHGWQTFSGVRVALQTFNGVRVSQSLVFCVMVGRLLVGFVWLYLQFSVLWQVDFQWGSCSSIFSFLCHDWQTFSGVRFAQSLVFCVMVGRLLVGFVWLNPQFCVMVGRHLVGLVWLNLLISVSWLVDLQGGSCGSNFSFLCHGRQTFSRVREAQSLVLCVKVPNFQWGSCGSIFSFLSHGWQTFSGVRVAQSLVFCVMVRILLVGFVCLNLQFSASWLGDFQGGSCGSNIRFLCHGRQIFSGVHVAESLVFCVMVGRLLVGFVRLNLQFSRSRMATFSGVRVAQSLLFCLMVGRLLVGSCGSIFRFLCHDWWTFSGVRVAQSFVFCVMVGRLLVGFVCLNLQFSVSWLVDIQWASCVSIFRFLCHGRYTFSGIREAQSFVFCVMVGRLLVGFVLLNLQFSVAWLVDFQWGSCVSIFSFLCHGWQTFSGVRVALQTFNGVRVSQSLVFCVMVGRLLVGFVWLYLQFSVLWQVDFQWGSCVSIFSFLCHGRQTFSGVRVAQSLVFCVMVGRLLVGFLWLNLLFSVSWLLDFQWGSCGSIVTFLCHGRQIFSGVRVAQSSFLCHGWQNFSGVRFAQSLGFCVMGGRLLAGFVWLNLKFSVSWLVDFQWGSCGSIFSFVSWLVDFQWGSCGSIFRFLCHGRQTFNGARVA